MVADLENPQWKGFTFYSIVTSLKSLSLDKKRIAKQHNPPLNFTALNLLSFCTKKNTNML